MVQIEFEFVVPAAIYSARGTYDPLRCLNSQRSHYQHSLACAMRETKRISYLKIWKHNAWHK